MWNGIHVVYISICSSWYELDNPDKGNLSQKLLKPHSISPEAQLPALVLYCECTEAISVSAWTPKHPVGYSMFCRRRNKFRAFVMRVIWVRIPPLLYTHRKAVTSPPELQGFKILYDILLHQFLWNALTLTPISGRHYFQLILFRNTQKCEYRRVEVILNSNQCDTTVNYIYFIFHNKNCFFFHVTT